MKCVHYNCLLTERRWSNCFGRQHFSRIK